MRFRLNRREMALSVAGIRQQTNAYFLRRDFPLDSYAWYAIDTDGDLVSDIRKAAGPGNRAYVVFSNSESVINKAFTEKELCGNDAPRPAFTIIERAAMLRGQLRQGQAQ